MGRGESKRKRGQPSCPSSPSSEASTMTPPSEVDDVDVRVDKNDAKPPSKKRRLQQAEKQKATEGESFSGRVKDYRVSAESQRLLKTKNIETLFEIQQRTFDLVFDGKDLLARSRTGTGKTLAFALPLIEKSLATGQFSRERGRAPKVLCLLPTRELALQVAGDFSYLEGERRFRTVSVYGGSAEGPQIAGLMEGCDVVVGTPGRVLDYLNRQILDVSKLTSAVLDEADQMLNMGFREDLDAILGHVSSNQNIQYLLFSATLPEWIHTVSNKFLSDSKVIVDLISTHRHRTEGTSSSAAEGVKHLVLACPHTERAAVLERVVTMYTTKGPSVTQMRGGGNRAIVFCGKKSEANEIAMNSAMSHICQVLHGDIQQHQREMTLKAFKEGRFNCLIATDVAARGVHIDGVEVVIQLQPPRDVETYIHRSGRTGRAGKSGVSILICGPRDFHQVQQIAKQTGVKFYRMGIPQPATILKQMAFNTVDNLKEDVAEVSASNVMKKAAQQLVDSCGAVEAVSRCLAALTDSSRVLALSQRSALSGREGLKAYCLRSTLASSYYQTNVNGARGTLRRLLRRECHPAIDQIGLVLPMVDGSGVCFDLPSSHVDDFDGALSEWKSQEKQRKKEERVIRLSAVEELPEIEDRMLDAAYNANTNRNSSSSYRSSNPFNSYVRGGGGRGNFGGGRGNFGFSHRGGGGRGRRSY